MTEWAEFIVFLGIGAWFTVGGMFLMWVSAAMGGNRNKKEAFFCLALLLAGATFLWVAFRDAPFTVSLKEPKP